MMWFVGSLVAYWCALALWLALHPVDMDGIWATHPDRAA